MSHLLYEFGTGNGKTCFQPVNGRYLPQWLAALVSWQMLPYIDITASFFALQQ
jgi:hypothetical protein